MTRAADPARRHRAGFTLIEMIVSLVLLAVAAAMVIPYFKAGVTTSALVLTRFRTAEQLSGVMQAIAREYYSSAQKSGDLATLSTHIANKTHGASLAIGGTSYTAYSTSTTLAKVQASDANSALIVTVTDTATGVSLTNVFTVQAY